MDLAELVGVFFGGLLTLSLVMLACCSVCYRKKGNPAPPSNQPLTRKGTSVLESRPRNGLANYSPQGSFGNMSQQGRQQLSVVGAAPTPDLYSSGPQRQQERYEPVPQQQRRPPQQQQQQRRPPQQQQQQRRPPQQQQRLPADETIGLGPNGQRLYATASSIGELRAPAQQQGNTAYMGRFTTTIMPTNWVAVLNPKTNESKYMDTETGQMSNAPPPSSRNGRRR